MVNDTLGRQLMVLGLWRINDSKHNRVFPNVNNTARMGYVLSESTFPIIINEVPDLNDPKLRDKHEEMIEAIKGTMYSKTFRSKIEGSNKNRYRDFLGLGTFYFTSNHLPLDDEAFQRRISPTYYSYNEGHKITAI